MNSRILICILNWLHFLFSSSPSYDSVHSTQLIIDDLGMVIVLDTKLFVVPNILITVSNKVLIVRLL